MKSSNSDTLPVFRQIFEQLCRIPHASGNEKGVAAFLTGMARARGLAVRQDAAGNLRIDRPAAPGFENAPSLLLQGHMDMVPQTVPGSHFDFSRDPITTVEKDGFLMSADQTTLGADDGIGVSLAMQMLLDDSLKCGPLGAVFTVEEETGLSGAQALSPEFLQADALLNIDNEDEHEFCIGCAGGSRLEIRIPLKTRAVPAGTVGVAVRILGLAGGHSGMDIDKKRGNPLLFLARFLRDKTKFSVASFSGGKLDNAIPREAEAVGAIAPEQWDALNGAAKTFEAALKNEFDAPESFRIEIAKTVLPEKIWDPVLQPALLAAIASCPAGVIAFDAALGAVRTSSNFAAVKMEKGNLSVLTLQRSFDDAECAALSAKIATHFAPVGGKALPGSTYPGWKPAPESRLLTTAQTVYREQFGRTPALLVIHAGVECGIFSKLAPQLTMVSMGPTLENPHSPGERLDVASADRFARFLRQLIERFSIQ